jgi:hypothetical protein
VERQIETLKLLISSKAVLLFGNHEVHYLDYAPFQFAGYNSDLKDHGKLSCCNVTVNRSAS